MERDDTMPRSAERLLAAIQRIKPHVPPDDFGSFKQELVSFLGSVSPALQVASSALTETIQSDEPNTTPTLRKSLGGGRHLAHVVALASALMLGFAQ